MLAIELITLALDLAEEHASDRTAVRRLVAASDGRRLALIRARDQAQMLTVLLPGSEAPTRALRLLDQALMRVRRRTRTPHFTHRAFPPRSAQ